jgi:hypothetical protein
MRRLINLTVRLTREAATFARKIWDDHEELLHSNPNYRRQLNIAAGAILAACALHPSASTIAAALLALWLAAHDADRPGWEGPGFTPRPGWD